jgi:hypothetical protein
MRTPASVPSSPANAFALAGIAPVIAPASAPVAAAVGAGSTPPFELALEPLEAVNPEDVELDPADVVDHDPTLS